LIVLTNLAFSSKVQLLVLGMQGEVKGSDTYPGKTGIVTGLIGLFLCFFPVYHLSLKAPKLIIQY
jgi:hypothetical protein